MSFFICVKKFFQILAPAAAQVGKRAGNVNLLVEVIVQHRDAPLKSGKPHDLMPLLHQPGECPPMEITSSSGWGLKISTRFG